MFILPAVIKRRHSMMFRINEPPTTGLAARDARLTPVCIGPWRGPNGNTNTFARESHIDAVAAAAGVDPLTFRLNHLKDKRMVRLLDARGMPLAGHRAAAPSGKGQGMACVVYKGTYVAAMGEVEVDKASGRCRVKRIVCAQDMGQVVNPEGAKMQIEGCVTMGLGYALAESIHFRDGEILDLNFDTYQIPKFSWTPKIEAILVENPDHSAARGWRTGYLLYGCARCQRDFRCDRPSTSRPSDESGGYSESGKGKLS